MTYYKKIIAIIDEHTVDETTFCNIIFQMYIKCEGYYQIEEWEMIHRQSKIFFCKLIDNSFLLDMKYIPCFCILDMHYNNAKYPLYARWQEFVSNLY